MRPRSFVARAVRGVVIYVHTAQAPTDEEWDNVLDHYRDASEFSQMRTLVRTQGGAPNPAQRARLNIALGGKKVRIAVLTASTLARAAGIAVSWFNPNVRIYGPDDVEKGLDHLQVAPEDRAEIKRTLLELEKELAPQ